MTQLAQLLVRLVVLLLFLGGCQATSAPPPVAAAETPLAKAMAFASSDAKTIDFTDWALLKEYEGATDITSARPLEERIEFLRSVGPRQAAASGFAARYLEAHSEQWGWDSTDLRWEATVGGDGPPLYLLRFRDDFDFDALVARFEARGYARSTQGAAQIFLHDMELDVPWRTELGVFNAALLPDEKLLLHAAGPGAIEQALDAYAGQQPSWGALPAGATIVQQLGGSAAATIVGGPDFCAGFSAAQAVERLAASGKVPHAQLEELRAQFAEEETLHPYLALGVGYVRDATGALGTVVMAYARPPEATADLAARQARAAEGRSLVTGDPYREQLFTLEEAKVAASGILLHLRPHDDRPQRLFDMLYRRDMTFAACP